MKKILSLLAIGTLASTSIPNINMIINTSFNQKINNIKIDNDINKYKLINKLINFNQPDYFGNNGWVTLYWTLITWTSEQISEKKGTITMADINSYSDELKKTEKALLWKEETMHVQVANNCKHWNEESNFH